MINPFQRIETKWTPGMVTNGESFYDFRFVGQYWIGWLIVKTNEKNLPDWIGRLFQFACRLTNSYQQSKTNNPPRLITNDEKMWLEIVDWGKQYDSDIRERILGRS